MSGEKRQAAPSVAYFSMELALESPLPTYSGGLGVLAGDTVRAAADLQVPLVAVTLLHRKGYFYQRLDNQGWQNEESVEWPVDDFLVESPERVALELEGRTVHVRAWRCLVQGAGGFVVPVFFLDTDLEGNSGYDRTLTNHLYGGDQRYRVCQEAVLGMGGLRMLSALGYRSLRRYHLNEGHAAFLTLELLRASTEAKEGRIAVEDIEAVRRQCVFTTHTPVPSGHDQFPLELVRRVLGLPLFDRPELKDVFCCGDVLNMTFLALNLSHYVNGVAKRHGEVSRSLFPRYPIDSITNGIHCATWASPHHQALFDRHLPGWRADNFDLRYAIQIPTGEVWEAHQAAKAEFLSAVNRQTNAGMDQDLFTLCFARRFTGYKRPDLLFHDVEALRRIAERTGPLQIVYSGKAHPQDGPGKTLLQKVIQTGRRLRHPLRFAFLENYDLEAARLLVAGVDLWLNTPQPPLEASGTSGMKAALNGVPSLSIKDGWWLEGWIEGVTGWAIEDGSPPGGEPSSQEAPALYRKLDEVAGTYYRDPERYRQIMRFAMALNGSFFNTQRMMQQYVLRAYF